MLIVNVFGALAARSLLVLLEKDGTLVVLEQDVVLDFVALGSHEQTCSTCRRHEVVGSHAFSLRGAASVDVLFVSTNNGKSAPINNPPPECPLMFGWTTNDASTHHFKTPLPLVDRISPSNFVDLRHCIRWVNLTQSSLLGDRALVVKNDIARLASGLDLLVECKVLATRL
jgi:hypothetical protein